jgi:hypothetical protein
VSSIYQKAQAYPVMDIELAATHEAGHAVMQWFVGLELVALEMTVDGTNASKPSTCCPRVPLPTLSDLRKRLLVLLAGNAVTLERWSDNWNDAGDWRDILSALREYLKLDTIAWIINDGKTPLERFLKHREPHKCGVDNRKTDNPEANSALQDAIVRCREIVAHPPIREAVGKVAVAFLAAPRRDGGLVQFEGREAVVICEAIVGQEFRITNSWSAWIAGEDQ